MSLIKKLPILLIIIVLGACSGFERTEYEKTRKKNLVKNSIIRQEKSYFFPINLVKKRKIEPYSFEILKNSSYRTITKEYFRCKGSALNPLRLNNDNDPIKDCKGSSSHSLPILNGREGVFPVLVDILNYIQKKSDKKVVITCGHRCPIHNEYADFSEDNKESNHIIGAEVDFYVQGLEEKPLKVIEHIFDYYKNNQNFKKSLFSKSIDYSTFSQREDVLEPILTNPWYNGEIEITLYQKDEKRDLDNRHPYPYISIKVLKDRKTQKTVNNFLENAKKSIIRW
jgi:hypothetical protein